MPKPLFTRLAALCAVGLFCVLFGCVYALTQKDTILLTMSLLLGVCCIIRLEKQIALLEENPLLGTAPHYMVLKRQGYKVLVLDKDLVFYKINEAKQTVIIYAIVDQRQDYLSILQGL